MKLAETWSPGCTLVTPGADLDHHPGALVAADEGERVGQAQLLAQRLGRDHVARDQVLVGVAQPGGAHLDQHLAGLGRVEVDLLDLPLLVQAPEHRGPGLHRSTHS